MEISLSMMAAVAFLLLFGGFGLRVTASGIYNLSCLTDQQKRLNEYQTTNMVPVLQWQLMLGVCTILCVVLGYLLGVVPLMGNRPWLPFIIYFAILAVLSGLGVGLMLLGGWALTQKNTWTTRSNAKAAWQIWGMGVLLLWLGSQLLHPVGD